MASLTFGGGADDDIFINTGSGVSGLNFNGDGDVNGVNVDSADDGVDILINTGSEVSNLTFGGGADDDVFRNSGANLTTVVFNGGADDDVLINTADRVLDINFNGDDDRDGMNSDAADDGVDILQNSGNLIGSIVFTGGADDDILNNTGNSIGTLSFTGGADDDVLNNSGQNIGLLNFNGDDGADVLANNGSATTLTFTGGADDDVLQNNGSVVTLTFGGGADDDILVNNASNVSTLNFTGDVGADTLINNGDAIASLIFHGDAGGDLLRVQGDDLGTLEFYGDGGADTLQFNGTGSSAVITYSGGDGNDFLAWQGDASSLSFDGADGNDQVLIIGSGTLDLGGGLGNDTFQFVGDPLANITIDERFDDTAGADLSEDTLDFSAFTGGALDIDLRDLGQQALSANFSLQFTDALGTENIVGTPQADIIDGNARGNFVSGAEFATPFSGPFAGQRTDTQWVFLDFDSATNTGVVSDDGAVDAGEKAYEVDDRNSIQSRIELVYQSFNIQFVQSPSELPADVLSSGEYVTIYFNETPEFGRPGGLASEIDPGNINLSGSAQVQVNGLLGGIITADETAEVHEEIPGVPELEIPGTTIEGDHHGHAPILGDAEVGDLKPAATTDNFIRLSAKIAAHELGHLLGLRHNDSFGPIGFGVHDPPGGGSYNPGFTGPSGGFESFEHLSGSPASIGSSRFTDLNDLYFGEREAVKIAYAMADPADTTVAGSGDNSTAATAQFVDMVTLAVPNTLQGGINEDKEFFVQLKAITGRIAVDSATGTSQSNWYKISGEAGELINIDVLSNSITRWGRGPDDFIDTIVRVYDATGELVPYYGSVAENDDQFEPTDSSIVDLILPTTGDYYIEVDTFSRDASDPLSDPTNPDSPLNLNHPANPAQLDPTDPDYELRLELFQRFEDTVNDTDQGNYQVVMYRFRKQNPTDGIDNITGNGGNDVIVGGPGDDFTLTFDLGQTATINEGQSFETRTITVNDRAATSWAGSTVDYGDGSGTQALTVDSTGTFQLSHAYDDNGEYSVTVVITNDIGQAVIDTFDVVVNNVAPTATPSFNDGPVTDVEGSPLAVRLLAGTDVSTADAAALRYSFGLTQAELTSDYAASQSENTANFTFDDNGTYPVFGRVIDKDGAFTDYEMQVVVANVAPTAVISDHPDPIDEGQSLTVSFSDGADVSSLDNALGLRYSIALDTGGLATDYASAGALSSASFAFDDNGTFTAYGRVFDKDGGFTDYTTDIVVGNVAPTASLSNDGPIDEAESVTVTLSAIADESAVDVVAGLRFSFATSLSDLATDYAEAGVLTSADFTFEDNGTFPVYARVFDKDNGFTDYSTDIVVNNVAPTVILTAPTDGLTNSALTITSTATDPGGTNDPLDYDWVITRDGNAFATQVGETSYTFIPTLPGTYVVSLNVDDGDGGTATASKTIEVVLDNQAPVVSIDGRNSGVRGQILDYTFNATDPNPTDQSGVFEYTIDWGDGSAVETVFGPNSITVSHVFTHLSDPDYSITVTAVDGRGLSSAEESQLVDIDRYEVQPDPLYPGQTILVVGGSTGSDSIRVRRGHNSHFLKLRINEWENEVRIRDSVDTIVDRVAIYAQDGDDWAWVSTNVYVPTLLDGGDGDDWLIGGYGHTILLGQDGNDKLFGGYTDSLLIGGRGSDKLYGWNNSDLLIAGYTTYDNDRASLDAIMNEWSSDRSYTQRRLNLTGDGTGPRANGNVFLKANEDDPANNTVFDDGVKDLLWGGRGADWFFANTNREEDSAKDRVFGAKWWEVITDLDREN
ncbi:MAG: hypothetical protein AB8G99_04745 [Planctomycetaceae bacterium]